MSLGQGAALFVAAVLGGTFNAIVGFVSFITLPTLIFVGLPPIQANATNTAALWPGMVASATTYRRSLAARRSLVLALIAASLVGGWVGAVVLLGLSQTTFFRLIPFLLLGATLLFTFRDPIAFWFRKQTGISGVPWWISLAGIAGCQFVIAAYGGFFGGGIGILMLALFAIIGLENVHAMNALRLLLAVVLNGMAVLTFVFAGAIGWLPVFVMAVGTIVGGYGGARVARRLDARFVRRVVITLGCVMTAYFFVRAFILGA